MLPSPSSIRINQKVGIPLRHSEIPLNVIVGHHPIGINVKVALGESSKEGQLYSLPPSGRRRMGESVGHLLKR